MKEQPRLRIEQDLAIARRALHRATSTAHDTLEFGLAEDLQVVNLELQRLMADVMTNRIRPDAQLDICTYLYKMKSSEPSPASRKPLPASPA